MPAPDNFVGRVLYTDLHRAYLLPETARALHRAQTALQRKYPDYALKVYDAARPMRIQQRMWNAVAGTSKNIYVSNPARGGGLHNYGLAVDLTLVGRAMCAMVPVVCSTQPATPPVCPWERPSTISVPRLMFAMKPGSCAVASSTPNTSVCVVSCAMPCPPVVFVSCPPNGGISISKPAHKLVPTIRPFPK